MKVLDSNPTTFSALTFEDSYNNMIHIETKDYGGVMYLANQAHYPFKPVMECGVIGDKNYIYAMDVNIPALSEMYWDYNGGTDDINDPLRKIKCGCGCGGFLITYFPTI